MARRGTCHATVLRHSPWFHVKPVHYRCIGVLHARFGRGVQRPTISVSVPSDDAWRRCPHRVPSPGLRSAENMRCPSFISQGESQPRPGGRAEEPALCWFHVKPNATPRSTTTTASISVRSTQHTSWLLDSPCVSYVRQAIADLHRYVSFAPPPQQYSLDPLGGTALCG